MVNTEANHHWHCHLYVYMYNNEYRHLDSLFYCTKTIRYVILTLHAIHDSTSFETKNVENTNDTNVKRIKLS
jgi:hypothetical protein